ncbi:FecR family protein [Dyadobacter tibetensis]|uniref:FecR family protein n=1 Tax=Dyadobacter tibetensis TaxID=1211851 RepID=UPI0004727F46|nr:FecR family protein [Dyadobacter tibetensis]
MKDYNSYQLQDYLVDPDFQHWVLVNGFSDPTSEWYRRLELNHTQAQIAKEAQELIIASRICERPISSEYTQSIIRNTLETIRSQENQAPERSRNWLLPFSVAASVAVLIIGTWFIYFSDQNLQSDQFTTIKNTETTGAYQPIALSDGSTVLLYPGSTLRFPTEFNGTQREVFLEGKAFFEIAKNARRPFLVHSQEMVTRVLGTSFLVDAFEDRDNFEVVVKSGKVSISTKAAYEKMASEVALEPNQRLVLQRKEQMMVRSVIATPQIDKISPNNIQPLIFTDTTIDNILTTLSGRYNVQFSVEGSSLADCSLTTTFGDEPLFEKLKIICQAIGPSTHYKIEGNKIIISTKGCNN